MSAPGFMGGRGVIVRLKMAVLGFTIDFVDRSAARRLSESSVCGADSRPMHPSNYRFSVRLAPAIAR